MQPVEGPARAARKVGLGVMGLAEMPATLGVPYDSPAAVALADRVFGVIAAGARLASAALAAERGPFPLYGQSTYPGRGIGPLRNAQLTSVAPTGTISLIAGTTSGIEPMFALALRAAYPRPRARRGYAPCSSASPGTGVFTPGSSRPRSPGPAPSASSRVFPGMCALRS